MHVISPGVYPPIDLMPILKYLPACFAPWQSASRAIYDDRLQLQQRLYEEVETRADRKRWTGLNDETETDCFIDWMIKAHPEVKKSFGS